MIYPNALQQGDTVMIIAPSGPPTIENVLKGVKVLQEMGLSVVIGKSVYEKYGYLAGRDQVRLDDIHEAFSNHEVKAVFCARGGYGSARLLLTFNMKSFGKIQKSFGDIAILQLYILPFHVMQSLLLFMAQWLKN